MPLKEEKNIGDIDKEIEGWMEKQKARIEKMEKEIRRINNQKMEKIIENRKKNGI